MSAESKKPSPASLEDKANPLTINERQQRFIKGLKQFTVPPKGDSRRRSVVASLINYCKREVRGLREGFAVNTVRNSLTLYRNEIRRLVDDETEKFVLRHLNLTEAEWLELRLAYEKKVTSELRDRRPLEIRQVERMIAAAKDNLFSKSYLRQTAALLMLTGRRGFEILKLAKFEPIDGKKNAVLFTGQAKTKEQERDAYEIPVLADAADVIKALEELRSKKDFSSLDVQQVNARTAKELGVVVEAMYGKDLNGVKLTPKDMRAIYSKYCLHKFCPAGMGETVYLASVLGHVSHNQLDRSVADSYNDFYFRRTEDREGDAHFAGTEDSLAADDEEGPARAKFNVKL